MEFVTGIVGVFVGALLKGLLDKYLFDRIDARRSGLDKVRQDVKDYFVHLTLAEKWLRDGPGHVAGPSEDLAKFQEEATARKWKLYELWDRVKPDIDSQEVLMALDAAEGAAETTFDEVASGNGSPDLAELNAKRKALKSVAEQRLKARL